jgi:hypothetical protein
MDCATRAPINDLETQLTYAIKNNRFCDSTAEWLKDNGYVDPDGNVRLSDRFNAILSGTTRNGNSFKAPYESIRKDGIIPKDLLPRRDGMTWAQYHRRADITEKMLALGQGFKDRILINWEQVMRADFYKFTGAVKYEAFDNYEVGDSFVKRLAPDYNTLPYGYRIIINDLKNNDDEKSMKLFKAPNQGNKVFILGGIVSGNGDDLYHHLDFADDAEAKAVLGANYDSNIITLENIQDTQIGFSITSKKKLLSRVMAFFQTFRGILSHKK